MDSVIVLTIDCEKNDGPQLAKTFNIQGYPTFVLANNQAQTLYRWWGYEKDFFLTSLKAGLADLTTIDEKIVRFKSEPDSSTAVALASYYDTQEAYSDAITYYKKAAELSNFSKDYGFEIFMDYYSGYRSDQFTNDELKNSAKNALVSTSIESEEKGQVYYYMSNMITKNNNDSDFLNFIKNGQEYFTELTDKKYERQKEAINILYTLYVDKNPDKAIELKKAGLTDGWDEDASELNGFSWWCFEHKINLDEAERLARKGAELAEPGSEKAMILDTVAEIVNLKGNTENAIAITKLAIQESPQRKYYQDQLKRFEKLIKK